MNKIKPSMMIKIAQFISFLFNPIISLLLFFIYYSFNNGATKMENFYHFSLIISMVILPIMLWIGWNVKKKRYTDIDVSNRVQRKTLYFFIESVQLIYIIVYYLTLHKIDLIVLFLLVLTLVMQCSNYYIKSSMHTAFNVFVVFLFYSFDSTIGILWGLFTIMVAFSRIILKRHTYKEIILGAFIGSIISFMYLYANNLSELKSIL